MDVVWAPFLHGRRVGRDVKFEKLVGVPCGNGFSKFAGGEDAVADGANAVAVDLCLDWVGDARAEEPLGWRIDSGKCDDLFPDAIGRRVDIDERDGLVNRRRGCATCSAPRKIGMNAMRIK